jgi:hypothetical protein
MAFAFTCPGCGRRLVALFRAVGQPVICHDCGLTSPVPSGAERVTDPLGLALVVLRVQRMLESRWLARALVAVIVVSLLGAAGTVAVAWLGQEESVVLAVPGSDRWPADPGDQARRLEGLCAQVRERVPYITLLPSRTDDGAPGILCASAERIERWRVESALDDLTRKP